MAVDAEATATELAVGAEAQAASEVAADEVPPPPAPPAAVAGMGPSERRAARQAKRATIVEPEKQPDDGPTYWRIGVDYEYEPEDEEVSFQCARIKKLENLEQAGTSLKRLILIANSIEKIENLEANTGLDHLELYQNLVKKIENINHLTGLTVLDLSFNRIRSTAYLGSCKFEGLDKLYLSSNKIEDVESLFHFPKLTMLELGANRIRSIPPAIEQLGNLRELWLGKNKIASMALPPMPNLRHLSMQNNRLEVWDSALFNNASGLTHLYLGHNNLPALPVEISVLSELIEIDLAKNAIETITPVPGLKRMKELWMNDNRIEDLAEVRNLSSYPALRTVYLERNPMHGLGEPAKEVRYKDAILEACPQLFQLDAVSLLENVTLITDGTEKRIMGIRKC